MVVRSYSKSVFTFVRNLKLSSKMAVSFCISPSGVESSCYFLSSAVFDVVSVPDFGHFYRYASLENPRDGRAWWAAVYGVAQSRTRLT